MLLWLPQFALGGDQEGRRSLWIDVYRGEPLDYGEMLDDLVGAGVVYLGEFHTLAEHHAIQTQVLTDLAKRGKPLVLGMEQLESPDQLVIAPPAASMIGISACTS